jgi:hypothetical protein
LRNAVQRLQRMSANGIASADLSAPVPYLWLEGVSTVVVTVIAAVRGEGERAILEAFMHRVAGSERLLVR